MSMLLVGMIWDLDGTLADTLPLCVAAFRHVFERGAGRAFSDEEIVSMFGVSEEGMIRRVLPDAWQDGLAAYLAEYERLHDTYVQPFPRIDEAMHLLRDRGIRQAVVTGKGPESAAITLRRLRLAPYFERVEVGAPEGPIKPRGMRAVLSDWGVPAGSCAYIGDAPSDVVAASEVGLRGLGAAWARMATVTAIDAPTAEAVFTSVDDLVAWIDREVTLASAQH
jgi:phosphoglycolate phosphatase-like HAD superfamily hydrolase